MTGISKEKDGFKSRPICFRKPRCPENGFTLIEVILVMVLIIVISGISLPYFSGAFKRNNLRTSARTIERMTKYARSMAIMREETLTIALNHETMEIFLGSTSSTSTNIANGEVDQDALKRLGYVKGDSAHSSIGIEKEVQRFLPNELSIRNFKKEWTEEDENYHDLYTVRFFPNGQCEPFEFDLENNKGLGIHLEIDPISGKIRSEFTQ